MSPLKSLLAVALFAGPFFSAGLLPAADQTLKISHQFPGSSGNDGDFRDRLVREYAKQVEAKTKGTLKFEIYPGSSLMKTNAQFSAMRKGALDMSLYPISYAGGEMPELNIGLMPGIVTSYEQGAAWRDAPVGKEFARLLDEKGIIILSWIWQAGGVASRTQPLVFPEDAKGMKVRGGSREMDMVLKEAGAAVVSLPSNEIYAAMQTGAMDAAMTSSTSLISFRLEELAKNLTTGRGRAYWFMLEPVIMSKIVFDKLTKDQQEALVAVGRDMEKFGMAAAKADDELVAQVYAKAGAKVVDLTPEAVEKWRALAREGSWKDYSARNENCARLMKLAEEVKEVK
jgi:TRAP-type C4-dicarboxylate transport system substrate-binding protein